MQKNRLIPHLEQAYKNCIEFRSNFYPFSHFKLGGVELYIRNVDLYTLFIQTHNSEKGVKK